jgi:hypothetical protein
VLSWHDSLEDAAAKYRKWMEWSFSLQPVKETPGLEWLDDLKLIIILDMGRSNGDIAHSYQHCIDLASELYKAGAKGGILFYLPGWCGKYDAEYPDYTPKDWLGGEEKFKEMVDVLHECGYRVMLHYLQWGADPFSPDFQEIKHLAAEGADLEHPPVGWRCCWPEMELDYDSERQKIKAQLKAAAATFSTLSLPPEPPYFEGKITLGGIGSYAGRVRLSMNARSLPAPQGHFLDHDSYTFPYTFLVYEGENEVTLEFSEAEVPDLSGAWYRIHGVVYSDFIHAYPIVRMDTTNDEWVELFTSRVIDIVRKYSIDAVHLDASSTWDIDAPDYEIDRRLSRALPGIAFSTEVPNVPTMAMFPLSQNGHMPEHPDKYSPLAHLILKPYRKMYWHLCGANGFVPVAQVCNCRPEPRPVSEEDREDLRQAFRQAPQFGMTMTMRVNYRDYGLDEETREAVLSLYSERKKD